ncbi:MAG TPA: aspartyl protease family protein [Edaphobacter sp.]|nr:aspartyl protease family protein [Edaphobacter sp.]
MASSIATAQQSCPSIPIHPDNPADSAYAQGNYKDAEDLYDQELVKHPKDAMLSAALVQTWLHEGEVDQAAAQAVKSLADNPGSAIAITAQAQVELHQGQPWLALTTLAEAAKIDPCYARIHFVRSRVFRIDSQYASERAEVQAAYDIDPNEPDIRHAWLSTVQIANEIESLHRSLVTGSEVDAETRQKATQSIDEELPLLSENNRTCKVNPTVTQTISLALTPAFNEMEGTPDVKRDLGALRPSEPDREIRNPSRQLVGYKLAVDFGQSKASLVVDTAASGITITRALADANGFAPAPGTPPGTVHVDRLKIGALEFKDCTVAVSEAPFANKGDGFIGTDMFAFSLIDLDQPEGRLTLSQLPSQPALLPGNRPGSDSANPLPAELEGFTPIYHRRQYLLVPVTLDGRAHRLFALDSGMSLSTLSSDVAHSLSATKVNFTNSVQTTSGSTLQIYRDAFDFQFASLMLPHRSHVLEFDPVAIELSSGIQIAGLIGFDILQSVRMEIDYRDGLIKFASAKFDSVPQSPGSSQPPNIEISGSLNGPESISAKRQGKIIELSLTSFKNKSEADVLRDLVGVELTERMSTQQLQRWKAAMPGEQSRKELIALADASAFLKLPDAELPNAPPMDKAAQQQLLARMNTYVNETMARLPNFFARQNVTTFEAIHGLRNSAQVIVHQPMHYISLVTTNVRYQNGKEVMETGKGKVSESDQVGYKLLFSGQFGPVLNTVLADAQKNKLSWSHWEPGSSQESGLSSPVAVFRYSVPRKGSHCKIKVVMPGNAFPSEARPGYHGEIAVDPASGTILRLTLIADLTRDDPMSAANLMVEYGPVELGGQTYICLIRSVTIETVNEADSNRSAVVTTSGSTDFGPSHDSSMSYVSRGDVPSATLLNDVVFDHYQILRTDFHIIFDPDTDKKQN